MASEDQKRWIIFVVAARGTLKISPLTEITKLMPASYLFPFISACWEPIVATYVYAAGSVTTLYRSMTLKKIMAFNLTSD